MNKLNLFYLLFLLVVLAAFPSGEVRGENSTVLNGAGASFPYPLYVKWFSEFQKKKPEFKFNYQPIGSGGGIRQLQKGTIDFAASDVVMKDNELKSIPWPVVQLPMVSGAVVIIYNLPEKSLKLDGQVLSKIFQGKIKRWNDPAIAALNAGAKLPDKEILVVHRSDGSGTTEIFTTYLASVGTDWKSGKAIAWPTGIGAKGNDGVTAMVKQGPYSIGYVELAYALNNQLSMIMLKNAKDAFISPTVESIVKNVYPISSPTYLIVPKPKLPIMKEFLKWALTEGQTMAEPLHYAPLSKEVLEKNLNLLEGK